MRLFLFVLLSLFALQPTRAQLNKFAYAQGAITRGDSTKKELALVFTADETGEGLPQIRKTLKAKDVKAAFFFTGRFYRNPQYRQEIRQLAKEGQYLGPHSDQHLLYCDWNKRDSLLVSRDSFETDMNANLRTMVEQGLPLHSPQLFIPPFEWWNDSIASWSNGRDLQLFNFTPGIRTNADYTWPSLGAAYKSSEWIVNWLRTFIATTPEKLNGAIVLIHAGTDPRRKDKLYDRLAEIIQLLKQHRFHFKRIDELLQANEKTLEFLQGLFHIDL